MAGPEQRRAVTAFVGCVALVAACVGGEQKVSGELSKIVLQPSEVPAAFQRFDEGRQVLADAEPGPRGDARRFGREGGWKARYRRATTAKGPLVIESRVDRFADRSGARKDLEAYEAELRAGAEKVDVPKVGEAALAATRAAAGFPRSVRFYTVAWRHANVTASVTVQGFEGDVTLEDALMLVSAQQRRIEQATH